MELPPWLKIENLIKNLSLSGWFKGWFSKTEVNNTSVIINIINVPIRPEPSAESLADLSEPKLQEKSQKIVFTENQIKLVSSINRVHRINGNEKYDFKEDYEWALYYIQQKPATDWPCNAAVRIAQAMQDVDLFQAFRDVDDPQEREGFEEIKRNLNYIYNRIIQELRHTDKRGQIVRQFKAPYHNELGKIPIMKDSDYENIFNDFQDLLIRLFEQFPLK